MQLSSLGLAIGQSAIVIISAPAFLSLILDFTKSSVLKSFGESSSTAITFFPLFTLSQNTFLSSEKSFL